MCNSSETIQHAQIVRMKIAFERRKKKMSQIIWELQMGELTLCALMLSKEKACFLANQVEVQVEVACTKLVCALIN